MNINHSQSSKYLEEAELTLLAAEAVFNRAKEERRQLWANVVKSCYDCMEQALSSALASRGEVIPKEHPAKVKLLHLFSIIGLKSIRLPLRERQGELPPTGMSLFQVFVRGFQRC